MAPSPRQNGRPTFSSRHRPSTSLSRGFTSSRTQDDVRKNLERLMKRPNEPSKAFICEGDLAEVKFPIQTILREENVAEEEIDRLCKECIKVLSILVWIDISIPLSKVLYSDYATNLSLTDEDLPLHDADKLIHLPFDRQPLFFEEQYRFIPLKISDSFSAVPDKRRLPWIEESEAVGAGGYGTVIKVKIPAGYRIYRDGNNACNAVEEELAYKRVEARTNFTTELRNLSILKESITKHSNIMGHIGFLLHETRFNEKEFVIILPLALGDLDMFLNEGRDWEDGTVKFENGSLFMNMIRKSTPLELVTQSSRLASALDWLHHRMWTQEQGEISCVHMDLKPTNILIMEDRSSAVGSWKISDFGISVINKSSDPSNSVHTIRDAYDILLQSSDISNQSGNPPQRCPGAYQAPEVQKNSDSLVGRKSDVWSFVCIFCEVLAFAIGRGKVLSDFREQRTVNGLDYYYIKMADKKIPGKRVCMINPMLTVWMNRIRPFYSHQGAWFYNSLDIIQRFLIVEPNERPNSVQLAKEFASLASQVRKDSIHPLVLNQYLHTRETELADEKEVHHRNSARQTPSTLVESINDHHDPHTRSNSTPESSLTGSGDIDADRSTKSTITLPPVDPEPHPREDFLPAGYANARPFIVTTEKTLSIPQSKPCVVSLSPPGDRAAWLLVDANSLHVHEVESISRSWVWNLPKDTSWKYLALNENFVAVAGRNNQSTHVCVHLYDTLQPRRCPYVYSTSSASMETLSGIDVNKQGRVIIVSYYEIWLLGMDPSGFSSLVAANPPLRPGLEAHGFECATFSPTGKHILAWSWGTQLDRLHVWVQGSIYLKTVDYFASDYKSKRHGSSHLKLLPYEHLIGCVMKSQSNELFCAGIHPNLSNRQTEAINKQTVTINAVLAVVFLDKWLVTVEKKLYKGHELKRYMISNQGDSKNWQINKECHVLGKLGSSVKPGSKIQILCYSDHAAAVICNEDKTVEIARFVVPA